jgi:hypothetical protein
MNIVALIALGRLAEAKSAVHKVLEGLCDSKLTECREGVGALLIEMPSRNRMKQGRTILIRRRIRKGKLQRNIRRSAVKGFTVRRGKIYRIPVAKRIHMRIVQKRASRKRKAHMQQTLRKRKLSLRKRKALGIR